jgi:hypothetical protein
MAYVSHLVLESFVGPRPYRYEACHFPDKDPHNNRLENLRWDTAIANQKDREQQGTANIGHQNPSAKRTTQEILLIRKLYDEGMRLCDIGRQLPHIGTYSIFSIAKRNQWQCVPEES